MSGSYWSSTQRKNWQYTHESLLEKRRNLEVLEDQLIASGALPVYLKEVEYDYDMRIFLHNLIQSIGRKLQLRSVPISTANLYVSRFLLNVSIKEINPYLLVATCVYLASKIEECPQHIRNVQYEARALWPEYICNDYSRIAEFEFYLIEELDNYLIVYNPYRSLEQIRYFLAFMDYKTIPSLSQKDQELAEDDTRMVETLSLSNEESQLCWSIINDSYITDIPLLYPPHIIAITSIYLTIILKNQSNNARLDMLTNFVAISNVNLDEITEAIQEIMTLYTCWDAYEEISVRKKVAKMFLNR